MLIYLDGIRKTFKFHESYTSNMNHKHGLRKHPLYRTWSNIKTRCYNVNDPHYKNWGGRGITMCDVWKDDFLTFHNWAISNGWEPGLTIERIDNDKGYEPLNCKWITHAEQAKNKQTTHWITFNGKTQSLHDWSIEIGIDEGILERRINYLNWSIERAITEPKVEHSYMVEYQGEVRSLVEWSEILGMSRDILYQRLKVLNWSVDKAFTTPIRRIRN